MGNFLSEPLPENTTIFHEITPSVSVENIPPLKDSLAFCGGGVCGAGHVGVVRALIDLKVYNNFRNFAGTSVGSLAASMCAVRATLEQLEDFMSFDFKTLLDDDYGIIRDTRRLWYEMGYYKGDVLYEKISTALKAVTGNEDITFADLKEYGTTLYIPVTHVYKSGCKLKVYSVKNTPDVGIALACRMSCTYPSIFRSLNSTSDGGIFCNYPLRYLPIDSRLGVFFTYKEEQNEEPVENMGEYLTSIICTLQKEMNVLEEPDNTIQIELDVSGTDFQISEEKKKKIEQKCYEETLKIYSKFLSSVK